MKKLIVSLFTAAILTAACSSLIGNVPTVFADDPAQTQTPIKSITMQVGNPMMTVNGEETPIRISNEYRTRQLIKKFVTEIGGIVDDKGENKPIILKYGDKVIQHNFDLTNDNNLSTIKSIADNFDFETDVATEQDNSIKATITKTISIIKTENDLKMGVNKEEPKIIYEASNEGDSIDQDNETLVPIRAFVSAIGGTLDWDGKTQTITLTHKDRTITLKITENSATVNDESKTLKVAPINDNNLSTIAFIAETFGFKPAVTTEQDNSIKATITKKISITKTADDLKMSVNGKEIIIISDDDIKADGKKVADEKAAPIVKDNRTLVPIRAFVEAIEGTVDWDGDTQTVTLTHKDRTIKLKINDKSAAVNGKSITLDVAPQVINDLTKMPIRFVAETFGFDVAWEQNKDTKIETITITPEYDTFDNTTNYSAYLPSVDSEKKMTDQLSLSCDGINYYYVDAEGNAWSKPITSDDSNPQTKPIQFKEGKIDNMRVFKGHLVGIIKENANDEGRAFISSTDGSNFKYFAVRTGDARDYSRNIITRNEGDKNYIYLLDSSDQQSYLRKFELNGDNVTEVEGRVFDKRLYAYSITDDYELYTIYQDNNNEKNYALHCIKRSSNATIDLGFSAYRLNNDHENFYTFKKINDTEYTPCRITKANLDAAFKDADEKQTNEVVIQVDTAAETESVKRLTVTKDENDETHVFYFDNTEYQEIIFND